MRFFLPIILIVLLFSCEPTRERVPASYPAKKIIKDAKALSESFCTYELEEAIDLLDSALKNYPEDYTAYWSKLGILIHLEKTEEAMKLIDSAIKREPDLPGNHFFKGLVYDARHDSTNAIKNYKKDIVLYDRMLDTMQTESEDRKTAVFNKAINQIYSGNKEGNKTLETLFLNEKDKDLKVLISLFVNMDRNDLINRNKFGSKAILNPVWWRSNCLSDEGGSMLPTF